MMAEVDKEAIDCNVPNLYGLTEILYRFQDFYCGLLVIERWLAQRWMILYRREGDCWICNEVHAVCAPFGVHLCLSQDHYPWVSFGVCVRGDSTCAAIEQRGPERWLLLIDGNDDSWEDTAILLEVELRSCVSFDLRSSELEWAHNNIALSLVDRLPLLADIYDVYLVANRFEQLTFVTADIPPLKKLLVYSWSEQWSCSLVLYALSHEELGDVAPCKASIIDVYVSKRQHPAVRVVVEASSYMRWWHWYELEVGEWKLSVSRSLPVEIEMND